jgi:hypothetical protein
MALWMFIQHVKVKLLYTNREILAAIKNCPTNYCLAHFVVLKKQLIPCSLPVLLAPQCSLRGTSVSVLLAPRWCSGSGVLQNPIMQLTFSILLCLATLDGWMQRRAHRWIAVEQARSMWGSASVCMRAAMRHSGVRSGRFLTSAPCS